MINRVVSVIILLLGLSACSNVNFLEEQEGWQAKAINDDINQWSLTGRLLIRTDEVLNANINWQHSKEGDTLSLYGLLGLGKKKIVINKSGISLDNGSGVKLSSDNVDGFIAQQIGFVVPLTALRRWVLGRPLKNIDVVKLNNGFEQLGWQVISSRYKKTEIGVLPHKLKVRRDKIKLTLIIDRWEK